MMYTRCIRCGHADGDWLNGFASGRQKMGRRTWRLPFFNVNPCLFGPAGPGVMPLDAEAGRAGAVNLPGEQFALVEQPGPVVGVGRHQKVDQEGAILRRRPLRGEGKEGVHRGLQHAVALDGLAQKVDALRDHPCRIEDDFQGRQFLQAEDLLGNFEPFLNLLFRGHRGKLHLPVADKPVQGHVEGRDQDHEMTLALLGGEMAAGGEYRVRLLAQGGVPQLMQVVQVRAAFFQLLVGDQDDMGPGAGIGHQANDGKIVRLLENRPLQVPTDFLDQALQ